MSPKSLAAIFYYAHYLLQHAAGLGHATVSQLYIFDLHRQLLPHGTSSSEVKVIYDPITGTRSTPNFDGPFFSSAKGKS